VAVEVAGVTAAGVCPYPANSAEAHRWHDGFQLQMDEYRKDCGATET
jgi:hypothetical protein